MTFFRAIFWLTAVALFMPHESASERSALAGSDAHDNAFSEANGSNFVEELQSLALLRLQQLKEERAVLRESKGSPDPQDGN